jgi:hypothetical protein
MLRRSLFWVLCFPLLLLMWGCAAPPPPPTGGMLVVRVMARDPVDALALQVAEAAKTDPMASVNGVVHSRVVGRWVDFLFPVPLPPGRYRVTHESTALAPFQLNFEVRQGSPTYVGRLVVYQDRSRPAVMEDRYSEDVLMFREVVATLRALEFSTLIGTLSAEAQEAPPPAPANVMEVVPVTEALVQQLPLAAREPFKRYLRMSSPRAFAVNDEGLVGMASGKSVVERALQECARQPSKRTCRIFSVDQSATILRAPGAPMSVSPSPAMAPPPAPPLPLAAPVNGAPPPPPAPTPLAVACNPPNPAFKGWLRLSDLAPDAAGARGTACAK